MVKLENNKRKITQTSSRFPYVRISCFTGQFNKLAYELMNGYVGRCDVFVEQKNKKITIRFDEEGDYSISKRPEYNSLRMCMEQLVTTFNIDRSQPYEIFKENNDICFYYRERGDVD